MNDTLADVASALDHDPFVLIVTEQRCYSNKQRKPTNGLGAASESEVTAKHFKAEVVHLVSGIVSRIDLLDFISSSPSPPASAN